MLALFSVLLFVAEACDQHQLTELAWWKCAYPFTPGFTTFATGKTTWCRLDGNDPDGTWPLNPACNNAGTCIYADNFQGVVQMDIPAEDGGDGVPGTLEIYPYGVCQCADVSPDENGNPTSNFVFNDTRWVFQQFTGDECKEFTYQLHATISYLIKITGLDPSDDQHYGKQGMLECRKGTDGSGVIFSVGDANALSIPDMTPYVEAVIGYPEYWGATDTLYQFGYRNYKGSLLPWRKGSSSPQHCKICTSDSPCEIGTQAPDLDYYPCPGTGSCAIDSTVNENEGFVMLSWATNFNTYYNRSCEKTGEYEPTNLIDMMPTTTNDAGKDPICVANYDGGNSALTKFENAINGVNDEEVAKHHKEHYLELAQAAKTDVVFDCATAPSMTTDCIYPNQVFGLGWDSSLQITRTWISRVKGDGEASEQLSVPTLSPTTPEPTAEPTNADMDCFDYGFTHQVEDVEFKGVAQAGDRGCRWGLDPSWPGGDEADMCDSPYVVCLPQENTQGDNAGFPMNLRPWADWETAETKFEPYPATDAQYTIAMCKRECAYDQRCNGFEFIPQGANGSEKYGTCKLIDDIPVVLTDSNGGVSANPGITNEAQLDAAAWDSINGAVCYWKDFSKPTVCNPYFGQDDLSDVMLKCYCPNNRKGFYTKNVERTEAATKFCDETQTDVTNRIRNAQANRMFHLCENWCLFNTVNPRTESWYHDPWEKCWREQYAGVGTHRSYCYRVIRDPYTIEQFFIDKRSENMCDASEGEYAGNQKTPSPVMGPVTTENWVLAQSEDSCDDACGKTSPPSLCNNADIETVLNSMGAGALQYFTDAGYDCGGEFETSNTVSPNSSDGWALPGVGPSGECILRHENANTDDLKAGCNVAIGFGYRRLCACGQLTQ